MQKLTTLVVLLICGAAFAQGKPITVVAAENFYGDIAAQIGGTHVAVTSILSNPDEDPHLFEASASTARALSNAQIVVYNGLDYDPWMDKLLAASPSPKRGSIVAATLLGRHAGDNPHLWYDIAGVGKVAEALTRKLQALDPANKAEYETRYQTFVGSLGVITTKLAALKAKYAGNPVTATEPVFEYMAQAIGLQIRNEKFQLAVMNNTEPSPSDMAALQNDLKQHKVKILFYNSQASDQAAREVQDIAIAAHVPVVGVTETEPAGIRYQDWMLGQLNNVAKALGTP